MSDLAAHDALAAHAVTLTSLAVARQAQAMQAYTEARTLSNRLALAQRLLDADLPAEAVVGTFDWSDEPNEDDPTTFDLDLAEAYVPNGEEFGDLGGMGAIPAGHYIGGSYEDGHGTETDWDLFMNPGDEDSDGDVISVAKVHAWLRTQQA